MVSKIQIQNLEELLKEEVGDGKIVDQQVTTLTAPGENYCSLMLKLYLEVEKPNGKREILNAVAKRVQASEKVHEFNIEQMKKEVGFYIEIVPIIEDFFKEYDIKEKLFCKVFGGRLDPNSAKNSVLVMENLVLKGYKNEDRHVGFDLETSKLILKKLAIFHATLIGLKLHKPEIFQTKVKPLLTEPRFPGEGGPPHERGPHDPPGRPGERRGPPLGPDGEPRPPPGPLENPYFVQAIEENVETAKYIPKLRELSKLKPFEKGNFPEPWNTIIHSDFWVNNVMINLNRKYEEQVILVDFQVIQYDCFAKDLLFFLFTSVQTPIQKQYFEELLKYYYEEFTKTLKTLKLDLPLSYEDYNNLLKETVKLEITHAFFFTNIIFGEKNLEHDLMSDENFDIFVFMESMMNKEIGHLQKEKILTIVLLAGKYGWI